MKRQNNNQIFKVGDEVECLVHGDGKIVFGLPRHMCVQFGGLDVWYSLNGCIQGKTRRTLYRRGTVKVVETDSKKDCEQCNAAHASCPPCAECIHFQLQYPYGRCETCEKKTAIIADGSTASVGQEVWHPDYGKMTVGERLCCEVGNGENNIHATAHEACYPRTCARLADGSVIMEGEKCWHPVHGECVTFHDGDSMGAEFGTKKELRGVRPSECYPIGSRVITPAEMDNVEANVKMFCDKMNEFEQERDKWGKVARKLADCACYETKNNHTLYCEGYRNMLTPDAMIDEAVRQVEEENANS